MNDIYALDLETRPTALGMSIDGVALDPWRVRQGLSEISSIAIAGPSGCKQLVRDNYDSTVSFNNDLITLLKGLADQTVYAHFATFDVAYLIATLQPSKVGRVPNVIRDINWFDTRLLARWIINGQTADKLRFSYSLNNLVKSFIKNTPEGAISVDEFLDLKLQSITAGEDPDYWLLRGRSDAIYTRELALLLLSKLPEYMLPGYTVEAKNIIQVSNSRLIGFRVDLDKLNALAPRIKTDKLKLSKFLGASPDVLNSPTKLRNLLFDNWGLSPISYTAKGAAQTGKDVLKMLLFKALQIDDRKTIARMKVLLKYKSMATTESKYINTMREALDYTGDGYIYGAPMMYGTVTGRFTYFNKTGKNKTGIAFHQLPRKAWYIRELLMPPEGFGILEADAAGQESRLMCIKSLDEQMLYIFKNELNFHSMSGAAIIGEDYESFMAKYKANDSAYIEHRQRGKLLNLAANYRIGYKAFANQAYIKYDEYIPPEHAKYMLNVFNKQYSGVQRYWSEIIRESKVNGFTREFGGRRYKITDWTGKKTWSAESTALMFPIQSAGASMKNIAIHEIDKQLPDVSFLLDLHDANFSMAPIDVIEDRYKDVIECLNNIDYSKYWGFKLPIDLPYEGGFGNNLGDVK